MLIRNIEINNFRQFYGKQKISFSIDPEKNVTLIHAENGVGKTAFLNAILWCFYSIATENFERKKDLLNHYAKSEGTNGYYVYIEFEEDGCQYSAQRQVSSFSSEQQTFRIYRISDSGNYEEVPNPEVFINSIIPKDMAGYFFFQGEGVGSLANNNGGDVRDAIRDILGFTIAEEAIKDIQKVKSEYRRELKRLDKSSDLGSIQEELANCEDDLRELADELDEADKNRRYVANKLKAVEETLRNSDSDLVSQKQKSRDSKEEELKRIGATLSHALERKTRLVGKYATSAFAAKAADEGIDFIDEKELKGTIPAPYNVQLVKDILGNEACICGSEIKIGTEAYGKIQSLLGKASDPILLNRVRRARSQLTVVKKELQDAKSEFERTLEEISKSREAYARVKDDLSTLSLEIAGIDFEGIKDKEKERVTLFHQLEEANKRYGALSERIEKIQEEKARLSKQQNIYSSTEPEVLKLQGLLRFIEELEEQLEDLLKSTEEDSIRLLQTKINQFLDLYVKQDFKAQLTTDFEIVLIDREGRPVGKSDGQSLLLSLTFISSLISLAKIRKDAAGNVLTPGAVAPFVVDAPFGVLDKSYKANMAEELPKSVNQIVFLLSSSHWEGTVEEVIRSKVGSEYNMVLEVASNQNSKEIGTISILGKNYDAVRYDCDVDMTRIEEIGNGV